MEEPKPNGDRENNKKIGADGLTKKERRAMKVTTKGAKPVELRAEAGKQTSLPNVCNKSNSEKEVKKPNIVCGNDNKRVLTVRAKDNKSSAQVKPVKETISKELKAAKDIKPVKGSDVKVSNICEKKSETAPSKAQLRETRRLLQEQQREAKAASVNVKQTKLAEKPAELLHSPNKAPIKKLIKKPEDLYKHQVQLFNHLYFKPKPVITDLKEVHPAFISLGVQYLYKTIMGSNARCLALLSALDSLVKDYTTPQNQEFCRSLESSLQNCVGYLQQCRPLAVSMTNALRHFKLNVTQIDTNLPDNKKKAKLVDVIETYIHDEIEKAGEAISLKVQNKIGNGDVILIYGCSSLIKKILLDAFKEGKKFEVVIVDARPLLEGQEMLRRLTNTGIKCTYILINAVSFIMGRVSKIMLGAHALLANGYVMSRTGTAQIALLAQAFNKPVLVCCETYKFCERVQTDSFVYNEIGDPDKLVTVDTLEEASPLINWRDSNCITPLNLLYDVTPPHLVTAVVTELGFLPCTSVPVVLRIKPNELG